MTATLGQRADESVRRALDEVYDPELDEPITDLGFVRSIEVNGNDVVVHLRLPTSFCSPNFAYLMASDAKDAIAAVAWVDRVVVELDDHHDSDIINVGLASDAGYRGTFRHEAERDLDELRATFKRKAHTAAMERCVSGLLHAQPGLSEHSVGTVRMRDLPEDRLTDALVRRRDALGLPNNADALVLVDEDGNGFAPDDVAMRLRMARSTRISIDGNAHFCRGLLRTRYPDSGVDQASRVDGAEPSDPTFIPLSQLKEHSA